MCPDISDLSETMSNDVRHTFEEDGVILWDSDLNRGR